MRALRSLLFVLLVLPLAQPAAYDGEEDGGQNAEFSVDRSSESGRPTTSRPNTSLKGDYDHEYSNERASGSSKSAEATTAASSPAARTTPTSSASYEVNLDSSESSTQYPAWVGKSSEERRTKGGAAYPQRAPVSSVAPSLRHAAGRTSALPSLRRQPPAAALPQPAAQHSQGRYQFAKMNGGPPPQAAGYAPARRQGPGAYSWAKMPFSGRQQPGRMGGGYQTKSPVAAPRSSPAAYRPALPVHQQPRGYARPSGGSAVGKRLERERSNSLT
ncbi:hypothetical protein M3Y99_00911800 [Aphelenchoides fujianensis]|nr:hypothetical protein M3Y99_00911800 [Aphelenchoides fujianensis]